MARPMKTGLDYFPLDTRFDDEVEMLEAAHGNDGFAVWIKTLQALYRTEAGVLDCSGVLRRRILAKAANVSEEVWNEVIETCVELGLLEWSDDERTQLASRGVRKRFAKVNEERERARKRANQSSSANNPGTIPEEGGKGKERKEEGEGEEDSDGKKNTTRAREAGSEDEGGIDPPAEQPPPETHPNDPRYHPPEYDDVIAAGALIGLSPEECRGYRDHYAAQGWLVGNGLPMTRWDLKLNTWKTDQHKFAKTGGAGGGGGSGGIGKVRMLTNAEVSALQIADPHAFRKRRLVLDAEGNGRFILLDDPLPTGWFEESDRRRTTTTTMTLHAR